jgi:hypothetical protein
VVRSVNLTKSEKWESAPGWGTHLLARGRSVIALVEGRDPSIPSALLLALIHRSAWKK